MTAKNKTIKFISALLIISILVPTVLFSRPQKAEALVPDWLNAALKAIGNVFEGNTSAQQTTQTAFEIKKFSQEIFRQILMNLAKRFLQEITKSTINWINSGYHGRPLFLENSNSFFKDIAKSEIKNLVTLFGYDSRRFPFGKDFSLNIINSYKTQLEQNAEYTLSKVINDPALLRDYRLNFNTGGWNGFLMNTQYPQNNYIGFQMLATEELARRLEGTTQNAAQKVKDTLEQGMGFLSPKACPSNPQYNNGVNEFNRPSFTTDLRYEDGMPREEDYTTIDGILNEEEFNRAWILHDRNFNNRIAAEKDTWRLYNECPGGLIATTPGSVVGAQITKALGSTQDQASLAAAMGNSVSAILDAMLNKFIGDGLNKLATKINPIPENPDTWDYYGNTLGSPNDGGFGSAWNTGPDEEIVLDKFKKQIEGKTVITATNAAGETTTTEEVGNTVATTGGEYIPGDIANTEKELKLMYNVSTTDPGITQMLENIWPKVRELDFCLPGPNIGWQERLENEMNRNATQLSTKASEEDGKKAARAGLALRELKFAVGFFKDWINNRMMMELPGSVLYIDAVDEIETIGQQSDELTDRKRARTQAFARLGAIKNGLIAITTQPTPGSSGEKILIELRKQYNAVKVSISNSATVEDSLVELNTLKDKWVKLNGLLTRCKRERTTAGWSDPFVVPQGNSTLTARGGGGACSHLLTSGASIKAAKVRQAMNAVLPEWEDSRDVLGFKMAVVDWLNANGETAMRGWNGNCNSSDNNLSIRTGPTTGEMYEIARVGLGCANEPNPTLAQSTPCRPIGYTGPWSFLSTGVNPGGGGTTTTSGFTTSGREHDLFCKLPIKGGYTHDSFVNRGAVTHPEIPLVNAEDVLKWPRWGSVFGNYTADIRLNCDLFFKSTILDYKKNIPGTTNITEPYNPVEDIDRPPGGPGEGEECPGPALPMPPGSPPDMSSIVEEVADEFPEEFEDSCDSFDFMTELVNRLHAEDSNFGFNGKRGNPNDLSEDAVSYRTGEDDEVHVIDVIGGHCGPNPTPTWNDVTEETYSCGTTGFYVAP